MSRMIVVAFAALYLSGCNTESSPGPQTAGAVPNGIGQSEFMIKIEQQRMRAEFLAKKAKSNFVNNPNALNDAQARYESIKGDVNGLIAGVASQIRLGQVDKVIIQTHTNDVVTEVADYSKFVNGPDAGAAVLPAIVATIVDAAVLLYNQYGKLKDAQRAKYADELVKYKWRDWSSVS